MPLHREFIFLELDWETMQKYKKLEDFKELLVDMLDGIPVEYQNTATISFDIVGDYGDQIPELCITYTRPKTEKEIEEQEKINNSSRIDQEKFEIQTYLALKEKYQYRNDLEKFL